MNVCIIILNFIIIIITNSIILFSVVCKFHVSLFFLSLFSWSILLHLQIEISLNLIVELHHMKNAACIQISMEMCGFNSRF